MQPPQVAPGRSPTPPQDRLLGRWTAAWLGATALGVANAGVRELLYADRVGELAAHQISTATLLAAPTYYLWLVDQRWPVPTTRTALAIGRTWAALTVLFESGLGHYVLSSHGQTFWPTTTWPTAASGSWCRWMVFAPAALHRLQISRS